MKVVVTQFFVDKLDPKVEYGPGQVLEWDDKSRIKDCIDRGLVKAVEEKAEKVEKPKAEPKKTATKKTATKK